MSLRPHYRRYRSPRRHNSGSASPPCEIRVGRHCSVERSSVRQVSRTDSGPQRRIRSGRPSWPWEMRQQKKEPFSIHEVQRSPITDPRGGGSVLAHVISRSRNPVGGRAACPNQLAIRSDTPPCSRAPEAVGCAESTTRPQAWHRCRARELSLRGTLRPDRRGPAAVSVATARSGSATGVPGIVGTRRHGPVRVHSTRIPPRSLPRGTSSRGAAERPLLRARSPGSRTRSLHLARRAPSRTRTPTGSRPGHGGLS